MLGEMSDNDRRDESTSCADKVDDAVKRSSEIRRQILWVLQVCHRGCAVEAQR